MWDRTIALNTIFKEKNIQLCGINPYLYHHEIDKKFEIIKKEENNHDFFSKKNIQYIYHTIIEKIKLLTKNKKNSEKNQLLEKKAAAAEHLITNNIVETTLSTIKPNTTLLAIQLTPSLSSINTKLNNIPAEVTWKINNQPVTFILASIACKLGADPNYGHYIAYRREGKQWFEINDDKITMLGEQSIGCQTFPRLVVSALTPSQYRFPTQLIYVKKSCFCDQFNQDDLIARIKTPVRATTLCHLSDNTSRISLDSITVTTPTDLTLCFLSPNKFQATTLTELNLNLANAKKYYCEFNQRLNQGIRFSFWHGSTGIKNATDFKREFKQNNVSELYAKTLLNRLFNDDNRGNTRAHSFKTVLLYYLIVNNAHQQSDLQRNQYLAYISNNFSTLHEKYFPTQPLDHSARLRQ